MEWSVERPLADLDPRQHPAAYLATRKVRGAEEIDEGGKSLLASSMLVRCSNLFVRAKNRLADEIHAA